MELIFGLIGIFVMICTVVGFFTVCSFLFGEWRPTQRWLRQRRATGQEDAISNMIISHILRAPEDWVIVPNRWREQYLGCHSLKRVDGEVEIYGFDNDGHFTSITTPITKFYANAIRPSTADKLTSVCRALQYDRSVLTVQTTKSDRPAITASPE